MPSGTVARLALTGPGWRDEEDCCMVLVPDGSRSLFLESNESGKAGSIGRSTIGQQHQLQGDRIWRRSSFGAP
jgi:hypothetical protein